MESMGSIRSSRFANYLGFLFFLSLGFSALYIDIGFALKPYMLVTGLIFAYLFYHFMHGKVRFKALFAHEHLYLLFLVVLGGSALYSIYPQDSLRFTLNAILIGCAYLILRTFFLNFISLDKTRRLIGSTGFIVALSSLIFYLIGMVALNSNFFGNDITSYGVLIDRGTPRLIGLIGSDPNIAAMFLSFFLLFLLPFKGSVITKLLLSAAIILTFSRGGYLALAAALMVFGAIRVRSLHGLSLVKKLVGIAVATILVFGTLQLTLGIDIIDTASGRFEESSTDNGSGRIDIWSYAMQTFQQYPIFGVGANSTLQYNINHYGEHHYVHNTYVEVLSELGLIGILLYIISIGVTLVHGVYCARNGQLSPLIMYIALLVAMTFLSVTTSEIYMATLLVLSLFMAKYHRRTLEA